MIVKIDYGRLLGTNLAVRANGSYEDAFIIIRVNKANLEAAIQKAVENKWIVGLEYTENPFEISADIDFKGTNVYAVYKILKDITEADIQNIKTTMATIHPALKVVVKTNSEFRNMQIVKRLCSEYPRLSFMGGTFLKLPDCHFGEVANDNLPERLSDRGADVVVSGDCSVMPILEASKVEYIIGDTPYIMKKQAVKSTKKEGNSEIIDSIEAVDGEPVVDTVKNEFEEKSEEEPKEATVVESVSECTEIECNSDKSPTKNDEVTYKEQGTVKEIKVEKPVKKVNKGIARDRTKIKDKPKNADKKSKKQNGASFAEPKGLNCF